MIKNLNSKYYFVLAAAAAVPVAAMYFGDVLVMALAVLVSCAALASLFYIKPSPLLMAVPFVVYGISCLLTDDYVFSAITAVFLPAALGTGLCMRKKYSRGLTIAVTCVCLLLGVILGLCVVVLSAYGSLSLGSLKAFNADYIVPLRIEIALTLYDNVYGYMNQLVMQFGDSIGNINVADYTVAYLQSLKPISVGLAIMLCSGISYLFTELSKQVLKLVDKEKLQALPGISGKWEYVLSKGSAIAFVVAYLCMFIGGDALKLTETVAFYAVIMTILGGILIMAFRSIRDRIRLRGWGDLIFPTIIIVLFLSDYILTILAIIGLVASFRFKTEDDEKCKK